jgi:hypothetical protein
MEEVKKNKKGYSIEVDLPCRYCNFTLPLNPRFLKDVMIIQQEFRILLSCPNCGIDNNISAEKWIHYRKLWNGVRNGSIN